MPIRNESAPTARAVSRNYCAWDFLAMSRLFIFADEAGCFNFSRKQGASKFYTVCTLTCNDCSALGADLLNLRRKLIWEHVPVGEYFHASEDKQAVRDRVFALLQAHDFSVQATIMEKSKAMPKIRPTNHRFYQYAWFYHLKLPLRDSSGATPKCKSPPPQSVRKKAKLTLRRR
jgi:hypothetical protein